MFRRALRLLAYLVAAAAAVALLVYIFSGAYRVPLRTALVPQEGHPWVRGSALLNRVSPSFAAIRHLQASHI